MGVTDRTLVFDLDGVVYLGDDEVPGAGEALAELGARHRMLFCTNNSSRTRAQTAEKIRRVTGFEAVATQVLTSATAAGELLEPSDGPAIVVGGDGITEMLAALTIDVTDDPRRASVVVTGVDHDLTYDRLAVATLAIRRGARFIATNGDRTFPTPQGQLPGAGAIVAALEAATDVRAEVAGKPHRPMRELIGRLADRGEIWMIGDRPDTDLAMAAAAGWVGVQVLTGVSSTPVTGDGAPRHVISSIADLPSVVASN